jgi:hypothetical protein
MAGEALHDGLLDKRMAVEEHVDIVVVLVLVLVLVHVVLVLVVEDLDDVVEVVDLEELDEKVVEGSRMVGRRGPYDDQVVVGVVEVERKWKKVGLVEPRRQVVGRAAKEGYVVLVLVMEGEGLEASDDGEEPGGGGGGGGR